MVIPKTLGRALITGGGTGVGLTGRYAGQIGGEETHQITLGEMPSHGHTGTPTGGISIVDINHTHNQLGTHTTGDPNLNHSHAQQGSFASGGSGFTFDHTHGVNGCTNVSTTGGGGFATGFAQAQNTGASSVSNFDHTHTTTISGQTNTVSSWHTHSVTLTGTTNYMNQNNTHNHTFTGNLMTVASMGSDLAHNNMQPWTAWNVMIRL
jgi:microcystin-dependent protein